MSRRRQHTQGADCSRKNGVMRFNIIRSVTAVVPSSLKPEFHRTSPRQALRRGLVALTLPLMLAACQRQAEPVASRRPAGPHGRGREARGRPADHAHRPHRSGGRGHSRVSHLGATARKRRQARRQGRGWPAGGSPGTAERAQCAAHGASQSRRRPGPADAGTQSLRTPGHAPEAGLDDACQSRSGHPGAANRTIAGRGRRSAAEDSRTIWSASPS